MFLNRTIITPFVNRTLSVSYETMYKYFDKGVAEMIGPFGVTRIVLDLITPQHIWQSGLIYHYAGLVVVCALCGAHIMLECYDI